MPHKITLFPPMFKDLRAGTKFLILCGVSLALTSVATYALLAEKQIAISFAHSELVGSKYLAMLRPIYRAVLETQSGVFVGARQRRHRVCRYCDLVSGRICIGLSFEDRPIDRAEHGQVLAADKFAVREAYRYLFFGEKSIGRDTRER